MSVRADLQRQFDQVMAQINHIESLRNTPRWGSWESQELYHLDKQRVALAYQLSQCKKDNP